MDGNTDYGWVQAGSSVSSINQIVRLGLTVQFLLRQQWLHSQIVSQCSIVFPLGSTFSSSCEVWPPLPPQTNWNVTERVRVATSERQQAELWETLGVKCWVIIVPCLCQALTLADIVWLEPVNIETITITPSGWGWGWQHWNHWLWWFVTGATGGSGCS